MKDVITVNAGSTGCNIGDHFFQQIAQEHYIDDNGTWNQKIGNPYPFFTQTRQGRLVPRTIFLDDNNDNLDKIMNSSKLFDPSSFMLLKNVDKMNDIASQTEQIQEKIRSLSEKSDEMVYRQVISHVSEVVGSQLLQFHQNYEEQTFVHAIVDGDFANPLKVVNECAGISSQIYDFDSFNCMHLRDPSIHPSKLLILYNINQLNKLNTTAQQSPNSSIVKILQGLSAPIRLPVQSSVDWYSIALNISGLTKLNCFSASLLDLNKITKESDPVEQLYSSNSSAFSENTQQYFGAWQIFPSTYNIHQIQKQQYMYRQANSDQFTEFFGAVTSQYQPTCNSNYAVQLSHGTAILPYFIEARSAYGRYQRNNFAESTVNDYYESLEYATVPMYETSEVYETEMLTDKGKELLMKQCSTIRDKYAEKEEQKEEHNE